jgi:uncharacterized protein YaiL (DUF2058 family)
MRRMSLRDQFKKANLISDKDARRLAHDARVERSQKGQETLDQEAKQRHGEIEQLQGQERERVRRDQERLDAERRQREELAAVHALLASAKKPGPGTVKFYFEANDGALPWLEVSAREAQEMRAGASCVVRTGPAATHTYRLLPLDAAKRVAKALPEAVVHAPRGVVPG